MSQS
ncbi:Protein of unknown function [Escherichia coli D6-113.11]|jgi:hypothetical protein